MMIAAVFVLVFCLFLVLYPYLIYPFVLRLLPKRPLRPTLGEGAHSFCLMFCAHNEERALPETLANLRRIKTVWPELQILAYSDCSTDRTFALLSEASDILTAVEGTERKGKAAGMRELVSRSGADVAIFMDANVISDASTIRRFETYFADPSVGAVGTTLHYINEGESTVAHVGGLYWRLEEKLKRLESDTGSTMGCDGAQFAMRRSLYPFVREDLQDDFLASMEVLFHRLRCVSAPDILAYERAATSSASEFRRKRRIACGAFSTHRSMAARIAVLPPVDRFKYLSHKVVRWFGAFFIALGIVAAGVIAFQLGIGVWFVAALVLGAGALAIALRLGLSPVVKVYEILAAMVATAIGVLESLFGGRYAVWNPVDR